jgi:hypothetical protein
VTAFGVDKDGLSDGDSSTVGTIDVGRPNTDPPDMGAFTGRAFDAWTLSGSSEVRDLVADWEASVGMILSPGVSLGTAFFARSWSPSQPPGKNSCAIG